MSTPAGTALQGGRGMPQIGNRTVEGEYYKKRAEEAVARRKPKVDPKAVRNQGIADDLRTMPRVAVQKKWHVSHATVADIHADMGVGKYGGFKPLVPSSSQQSS